MPNFVQRKNVGQTYRRAEQNVVISRRAARCGTFQRDWRAFWQTDWPPGAPVHRPQNSECKSANAPSESMGKARLAGVQLQGKQPPASTSRFLGPASCRLYRGKAESNPRRLSPRDWRRAFGIRKRDPLCPSRPTRIGQERANWRKSCAFSRTISTNASWIWACCPHQTAKRACRTLN